MARPGKARHGAARHRKARSYQMLTTEQEAKSKWCWQPRNADMRCKASDCAMWRWWPEPTWSTDKKTLRPRTVDDSMKDDVGYCGLAGPPLTMTDIYPEKTFEMAQADLDKAVKKMGK
jgi:hypothetical protein